MQHTQKVHLLGGNSLTCALLDGASCLQRVPTVRSMFQGQDVIIQITVSSQLIGRVH